MSDLASLPAPAHSWGPVRSATAGWTEHQVQAAVVTWAKQMERRWPEVWALHAVLNFAKLPRSKDGAVQMGFRIREGLKFGVPDLCLPVARGGFHGLYLETKRIELRQTKTLGPRERRTDASPEQDQWRDFLHSQGYRVERYWTPEEGQKILADYLAAPAPP